MRRDRIDGRRDRVTVEKIERDGHGPSSCALDERHRLVQAARQSRSVLGSEGRRIASVDGAAGDGDVIAARGQR